MAIPRSIKGKGKKYGHTRDVRPPAEAVHPIVEPPNNSEVLAQKQLAKDSPKKRRSGFHPTDNAKFE